MSIYDIPVRDIHGRETTLREHEGKVLLIANVASFCGFTPHYKGLQSLHDHLGARGFEVLGFPCNQFGNQEPGTAEEIVEFCTLNFGVSFPIFEKLEVNGPNRHPLFAELEKLPNEKGKDGDVRWNFEKFIIAADGTPVARFGSRTQPEAPDLLSVIERELDRAKATNAS